MITFLLLFAALILLGGCAMDMYENAVFGDERGAYEARVLSHLDEPVEIAARIHAQMVADGLFRDTSARERATDEVSA
ncbi:hypothetical protein IP90_00984 [Luteimonas cucumeris]|uniref:Uncharacterized protein n=1 Tax=Luteimonas cucumeris TaxID=985012 RepID=A0A562LBK8_9GAMM|nr:hypothetical protein [Luteimonas cucumeris]TWI04844.1 hypothetical protein IP90_00984 [Luteimonas cucumeris]